jgi:hypothetical protein
MQFGRTAFCAALAAVAIVAWVPAAVGGAASTPRGWHAVSVGKSVSVFPLGRASGRVWFVSESVQGAYTVWSARVASGRLTSLVSTPEGKNDFLPSSFILGSSLVNCCTTQVAVSSSVAPLLASGKVGPWSPLAGNPEKTAQDALTPPDQIVDGRWEARDAITIGARTVWAITGHNCPASSSAPHQCTINGGGFAWFAVCCTAGGQPSNLSSLLTARFKGGATDVSIGEDTHGRLWLAWLDRATSRPGVAFKLVQLDPATLQPLSVKKLDHALLYNIGAPASFAFVCADQCRLAYQAVTGAFSWGGTGAPTRLWKDNIRKGTGGWLLGAGLRAGGLDAANYGNKVPNVPDNGQRLTLKHGSAAGRHLRARRSIGIPQNLPAGGTHYFFPMGVPLLTFTPTCVVVFALYEDQRPSGVNSRLLAAVLHG